MTKLWLLGLAASAALAPMAAAQAAQTVPDPDPFYGLPKMSLKTNGAPARAPTRVAATPRQAPAARSAPAAVARAELPARTAAPAGVTWREPVRVAQRQAMPAPRRAVREMPSAVAAVAAASPRPVRQVRNAIVKREVRRAVTGRHGGGGHFGTHSRIVRGGFIPPMWMGPQFMISNWGMYGFPQPMSGRRWIRYYDDALLIDRSGRVLDGRYGMDWDRYGDRWDDRDGVPVYAGDYGRHDDRYERDEDWDDRYDRDDRDYGDGDYGDHGRGHDRRDDRVVYGHGGGGCGGATMCGAPPPPPQPAYGYGYTYGGCGCGPVVITETVTTTAPVMESRTYYEYVRERAPAPAPRRYRAPARRMAPPPPPPPPYHDGERG